MTIMSTGLKASIAALCLSLVVSVNVNAQALDIDKILSATGSAANKDSQEQKKREDKFKAERSRQQGRLNSMKNERVRQENLSTQLEASYEANDARLEELRAELLRELGDLKELFAVIQETASEQQSHYKKSLISVHYPERAEDLRKMVAKMANLDELVSIDEIENLWLQLQTEMSEQGKIVKFNAPVTYFTGYETDEEGNQVKNEDGKLIKAYTTEDREVTRIGVFNAVTGNDIAIYDGNVGLKLLERPMDSSFTSRSQALQGATGGLTSFNLDPTKGVLLSAFVQKPTILEKVQEGGAVGYVIIGLGVIAILIAIFKLLVLSGVGAKVRKQASDLKRPSLQNPLGRVIKVYQDNPHSDPESMELKLSEAILKESPKLNSWVMFIKIIAVVAPLLGLLGTVTGMIQTFQAITLHGAGDPQTMAGGISKALVTTVLGLVVAIPTVFMHWLVSGRASKIEATLEESASGLVAEQYLNHKA